MAKKRVNGRASRTTTIASNDGATNSLQEETTLSSSTTVKVEGAEIAFETKNGETPSSGEITEVEIPVPVANIEDVAIQEGDGDHSTDPLQEEMAVLSPKTVEGEGAKAMADITNEGKPPNGEETDEESAVLVLENDESATKVESEEVSSDKEKIEIAAFEGVEDEGFDEQNSTEERGDDKMSVGEGAESWPEEEEEDDDGEEEEEEEDEEEKEDEEEEEPDEIGDEEAEKEEEGEKEEENVEESILVEKTEERIEANSGVVAKKAMVEGRLKEVSTEAENKATPSKRIVASTGEVKPVASIKKKVATIDEEKPKALTKKKAGAEADAKSDTSGKTNSLTTVGDKPKPSGKKKASKKGKSMGLIFMCNSNTKQDCYRYKVLGLPASKKGLVGNIYKGMRLFLFDTDLRLMYGIYKAAGPGGFNIQPNAFGSAFPSQVRFTVVKDCLPLAEEKFKHILKDNYYAKKKFDCQLNSEQVKNLCKLFSDSGKVPRSKNPKNAVGTETRPDADRARIGGPKIEGERLRSGRIRRKGSGAESLDLRPRLEKARLDRGRIKRQRLDEEIIERGRTRKQMLEEERLDRYRIRQQRRDDERLDRDRIRRQRLDEDSWVPRYHDRPIVFERERHAPPLPPPARGYGSYDRTETAAYMRDPVVDHRDRMPVVDHRDRMLIVDHRDRMPIVDHRDRMPIVDHRDRMPIVDHRDRMPIVDHRDRMPIVDHRDRIPIVDHRDRLPIVDHRDRLPIVDHRSRLSAVDHRDPRILDFDTRTRDEVRIREPYASYREYNLAPRAQAATYPPPTSSISEYRRREEAPAYDYGHLRAMYRY